ncbi:uncharacterized protein (TIGR04222 family) [Nonomuraea polychroma]|uniref:Uncharacterized protein (TIGR04222 family) n=1 Tax=Nonomuraea polychroma TaxID=46176 RepID=A0A438MGV8_9ACTN|nr:TIGR04222 domain-containing membrane protein [Nonomuraea polychroma]RVX45082.1 uncharacterized protein (TIGR04222 family) [Nonomuraea polychroma]
MLVAAVVIGSLFLLLWLYVAVLYAQGLWALRGAKRAASAPNRLSPYELAWMAGWGRRVGEAVVAGLIDRGAVGISRAGTVTAVSGAVVDDPIERAVLGLLSMGPVPVWELLPQVAKAEEVVSLGARMAKRDQGPPERIFDRVHLRGRRIVDHVEMINAVLMIGLVLDVLVLVAGLFALAVPEERETTAGFVLFALGFAALAGISFFLLERLDGRGRSIERRVRDCRYSWIHQHDNGEGGPRVAYAVAVGGFDRIEDAELRQALMAVPPRPPSLPRSQ